MRNVSIPVHDLYINFGTVCTRKPSQTQTWVKLEGRRLKVLDEESIALDSWHATNSASRVE